MLWEWLKDAVGVHPLPATIAPVPHLHLLRSSTFGDGGDLSPTFDGELKVEMCTIFSL